MEDLNVFFEDLDTKSKRITELQSNFGSDTQELKEISEVLVTAVDSLPPNDSITKNQRAMLQYYKGKALAVCDHYDKKAEDCLSKSLKLNPQLLDAWVCLGEVFYQKRDFVQSKRSFESGLENCGPNKEILRKLSMVIRLCDEEAKENAVKESLQLAKQAVALDLTDGYSWYVLGNAHLTNFFTSTRTVEELEFALKAYNQSESNTEAKNPDLHFNRATAFKFIERYAEAVQEFMRANEIDRALNAMQEAEGITRFLFNLTAQINSKCKYRGKKLHGMLKTIPAILKGSPFGSNCQIAALNDLQTASNNTDLVLSCRLMHNMKENSEEVPQVFVATDFRGTFFAISFYNSSKQMKDVLVTRANVMIKDPLLESREIGLNGNLFSYLCIRVSEPENVMVNNEKIAQHFAPTVIKSQAL